MPIDIQHDTAPYYLGSAHFTAGERLFSASADKGARCHRPIRLAVVTDDHRSNAGLSIDEAEALIACLQHAVALRREAEAAAETRKSASA